MPRRNNNVREKKNDGGAGAGASAGLVCSLENKKCQSCEGLVGVLAPDQVAGFLKSVPEWKVSNDGKRIRREWKVKNFMAGMKFFELVAAVAEQEGHHPDLHLVGYSNVSIELWTHAINGLSENDFILAAKIDALPITLSGARKPASQP